MSRFSTGRFSTMALGSLCPSDFVFLPSHHLSRSSLRFPDVSFNSLLKTLSETLNLHLSDKWRPQIKECVQGVINIKKALRQQDLYRDHEAIVRELRKDYYPSLNDDWDSCIKKWVVRIQEKVYFYIYSIYIYNSIYMTM